jgi:hypothetical protein
MAKLAPAGRSGDLPALPVLPPLPPNASPGRRWRWRRDLVIFLAHRRLGLSQRFLADVFDLPRSRIAAILQGFPERVPAEFDVAE